MENINKRFSEISGDKNLRESLTERMMQIVAGSSDFSIEERNDMNLTLSYYLALDATFQDMMDNIMGNAMEETVEYILGDKEE